MQAPFVAPYGSFNLSQHKLGVLADRRAEGGRGSRRVPFSEEVEVRFLEICLRVVTAAGNEGVGGAGRGGADEARPQLVIIIPGHERAVNDVADVVAVGDEVHLREVARGVPELAGEPFALRAEVLLQAELDFREVCVVHRPRPERARIATFTRVRHVENVPQQRRVAAVVHECYAFRPAPHIAPHALRPHTVLRAGPRVRPLRVNEHLVGEAVLVIAGDGAQQRRPLAGHARDVSERVVRQLGDGG